MKVNRKRKRKLTSFIAVVTALLMLLMPLAAFAEDSSSSNSDAVSTGSTSGSSGSSTTSSTSGSSDTSSSSSESGTSDSSSSTTESSSASEGSGSDTSTESGKTASSSEEGSDDSGNNSDDTESAKHTEESTGENEGDLSEEEKPYEEVADDSNSNEEDKNIDSDQAEEKSSEIEDEEQIEEDEEQIEVVEIGSADEGSDEDADNINTYAAILTVEEPDLEPKDVVGLNEEVTISMKLQEIGYSEIGSAQIKVPDHYSNIGNLVITVSEAGKSWDGSVDNDNNVINLWAKTISSYLEFGEWVRATFNTTTPNEIVANSDTEIVDGGAIYDFSTKAWTVASLDGSGEGIGIASDDTAENVRSDPHSQTKMFIVDETKHSYQATGPDSGHGVSSYDVTISVVDTGSGQKEFTLMFDLSKEVGTQQAVKITLTFNGKTYEFDEETDENGKAYVSFVDTVNTVSAGYLHTIDTLVQWQAGVSPVYLTAKFNQSNTIVVPDTNGEYPILDPEEDLPESPVGDPPNGGTDDPGDDDPNGEDPNGDPEDPDDTIVLPEIIGPFTPFTTPLAAPPVETPVELPEVPVAAAPAAEPVEEVVEEAPEAPQVEVVEPEEPQVLPVAELQSTNYWPLLLLLIPGLLWFLWARLVLVRVPNQDGEYKTVARKLAKRKDKRWYVEIGKQLDEYLAEHGEVMVDFRGGLIKEAKKAIYTGETVLSAGDSRFAVINRQRFTRWIEKLNERASRIA